MLLLLVGLCAGQPSERILRQRREMPQPVLGDIRIRLRGRRPCGAACGALVGTVDMVWLILSLMSPDSNVWVWVWVWVWVCGCGCGCVGVGGACRDPGSTHSATTIPTHKAHQEPQHHTTTYTTTHARCHQTTITS